MILAGMTFILKQVHSIFIYFFVFFYMILKCHLFPVHFIPVFSLNRILILVWSFLLVSCKLTNKFLSGLKIANRKSGTSGSYFDWHENLTWGERLKAEPVNFIIWMKYKLHSGMKVILVSWKQSFRARENWCHFFYFFLSLLIYLFFFFSTFSVILRKVMQLSWWVKNLMNLENMTKSS